MAITLNYTTLKGCNATSDFPSARNIGTVNNVRSSDYVEREGTDCLDFGAATGGPHGVRSSDFTSSIDITSVELGAWFLLPKGDDSVNQFLYDYGVASPGPGAGRESLRLRVYSTQSGGERWAEYDQGSDDNLVGGWLYLRCSGDAGTEDGNSGTWTSADAQAVNSMAFIVYNVNANNGTFKNETARYGIDFVKSYTKFVITGYNGGTTPWNEQDIFDLSNTKPFLGVVEKTDIFYRYLCGIDFGDGSTTGAFTTENNYFFFDQFSTDVSYNITFTANHTTTFGKKDVGTDGTYAINGCQIVNNIGTPNITAQSGAPVNLYACRIEGWNTINLGSGGSGSIDIIKTDFFDNTTVELRSTGLQLLDIRLHFPDGSEAAVGTVFSIPSSAENVRVFQVTDGLTFRANATVTAYVAGDTTKDLVVLEGVTVNLINSIFDSSKLKRVAT